jgi:hypothetical protein
MLMTKIREFVTWGVTSLNKIWALDHEFNGLHLMRSVDPGEPVLWTQSTSRRPISRVFLYKINSIIQKCSEILQSSSFRINYLLILSQ